MKRSKEDIRDATARLRKVLKPGKAVYCVLERVSKSGMQRSIKFYTMHKGGLCWLTGDMAAVLGYSRRRDEQGMTVDGCGMDMGFSVVYNLGRYLWPNGVKKDYAGRANTDGGYALRSQWL